MIKSKEGRSPFLNVINITADFKLCGAIYYNTIY